MGGHPTCPGSGGGPGMLGSGGPIARPYNCAAPKVGDWHRDIDSREMTPLSAIQDDLQANGMPGSVQWNVNAPKPSTGVYWRVLPHSSQLCGHEQMCADAAKQLSLALCLPTTGTMPVV